ncbi:MAG: HugZ family protein [Parvibaculum sp.]|nr:HugZ family protein [Parvibaculum sp.]
MAEPANLRLETSEEVRHLAKMLIRTARYGALAVLEPGTGRPVTARTGCAADMDGTPFILISTLSAHTTALQGDPRCSLLLGEPGKGDPLAHPRISLIARAVRVDKDSESHARLRGRYLARHPKAGLYVDFPDFAFFRIEIERAFLNGGFGKAHDLTASDIVLPASGLLDDLSKAEAGIIAHMNADHADAIGLYATVLAGAAPGPWRIASFDPHGLDLIAGGQMMRLDFARPLESAAEVRPVLVQMAKDARAKLAD